MENQEDKLKKVWDEENRSVQKQTVAIPDVDFNRLISSLLSVGPFYFYVIDFFDMSLSHVSSSIRDIHGFDPETVTFDDILKTIHPDDMDFVAKAERGCSQFMYNFLGKENILNYKFIYSFRSRLTNGDYCMLNHQTVVLTTDENWRVGKALNIHTNIDHLTKKNSHTFSVVGLKGNTSYMDIKVSLDTNEFTSFSKREIDIIKYIADGLSSVEISNKLCISDLTVKKHRNNILKKSACKNTAQLVKDCILQGLI